MSQDENIISSDDDRDYYKNSNQSFGLLSEEDDKKYIYIEELNSILNTTLSFQNFIFTNNKIQINPNTIDSFDNVKQKLLPVFSKENCDKFTKEDKSEESDSKCNVPTLYIPLFLYLVVRGILLFFYKLYPILIFQLEKYVLIHVKWY